MEEETVTLVDFETLHIKLLLSLDTLEDNCDETTSDKLLDRVQDLLDFYITISTSENSPALLQKNIPILKSDFINSQTDKLNEGIRSSVSSLKILSRHFKYAINDSCMAQIIAFGNISQNVFKILTENFSDDLIIPAEILSTLSSVDINERFTFSDQDRHKERYDTTTKVIDQCINLLEQITVDSDRIFIYKNLPTLEHYSIQVKTILNYLSPIPSILSNELSQIRELKDTLIYLIPLLKKKLGILEERTYMLTDTKEISFTSKIVVSMRNVLVKNDNNASYKSIFEVSEPDDPKRLKENMVNNIRFISRYLDQQVPSKFSEARLLDNFEMASTLINTVETCLKLEDDIQTTLNEYQTSDAYDSSNIKIHLDEVSIDEKNWDESNVTTMISEEFVDETEIHKNEMAEPNESIMLSEEFVDETEIRKQGMTELMNQCDESNEVDTTMQIESPTILTLQNIQLQLQEALYQLKETVDIEYILNLYLVGACIFSMLREIKDEIALKNHLKTLTLNMKKDATFTEEQKETMVSQGIKVYNTAIKLLKKIEQLCRDNKEEDCEHAKPVLLIEKILEKVGII